MTLAGLADAVLADRTLTEAMADARGGAVPALDLTGPEALRPFVVTGLVRAGRTVLAVTATSREAEDLVEQLGSLLDPSTVAYYPSWETLPHERLSPRSDTVGKRLAVLRRLVHPGTDEATRTAEGRGGAGPVGAPAAGRRAGRPRAGRPQARGHRAAGGRRPPAGRRGVLAGRPGREARRVRGPRRHRRRVPADRGAPAARGVLGRRRRGDPQLLGRRPAHPREGRPSCGRRRAASCCSPTEVRERAAELGRQHPQLVELTDKIAAGIATEGMEALSPVLVDEMELLVDLLPADTHVLVLDPERARRRAHDLVATSEEFLGASWAAAAGGGSAPIDLGAASYRSLGDVREHAVAQGKAWWSVSPFGIADDADAGEDERGARPGCCRCRSSTPTAATSTGRSPTSRSGGRRATARSSSTPVTVPPSAPSRHSGSGTSPRGSSTHLDDAPAGDVVTVTCGALSHGFVDDEQPARPAHRRGPLRPARLDPRHARRCPTRRKKQIDPLELKRRRLRRARAARRRPVRGDEAARGAGRDPRVPRPRVRRLEAWRAARPPLRAGRRARPGHPLRRRRAAEPRPAGRLATGPSARAGPARRSARSRPS